MVFFISIAVFFLLPELIFRIIDRNWHSDNVYRRFGIYERDNKEFPKIPIDMRDPYLFWRVSKDFEFRGIPYNVMKDSNAMRIICLGDSCTQGFSTYVRTEQTYPFRLQKILNTYNKNSGKHFEVINAGIGGYSSLQGLRYFKRELLKYDPDVVTFYFGINDKAPSVIYSDIEQRIFPQWIVNLHNIILERSRFYKFIVYFQKKRILESWERKRSRHAMYIPRVSIEDYRGNIEALYRITEEMGIKLVIINLPTESPEVLSKYNAVLKDIIVQYNIPLVDIVKAAEKYRKNRNRIFIDKLHPTPYFNKIIAKEIYKILILSKYI